MRLLAAITIAGLGVLAYIGAVEWALRLLAKQKPYAEAWFA